MIYTKKKRDVNTMILNDLTDEEPDYEDKDFINQHHDEKYEDDEGNE